MRNAKVFILGKEAGIFSEPIKGSSYEFLYLPEYKGLPVSRTMPVREQVYAYDRFPPFFDGVLPEGFQLQSLLKARKLDEDDYFGQLIAVGKDMIGAVTLEQMDD
jgi:serine/threonine-protein kinase HipA